MGYKQMQESFRQSTTRDQSELLKIFGRLTTNPVHEGAEISACDQIQFSYYIENKPNKIKTEAYYCTKNGKVKGVITLTEHLIMFDPIKC